MMFIIIDKDMKMLIKLMTVLEVMMIGHEEDVDILTSRKIRPMNNNPEW